MLVGIGMAVLVGTVVLVCLIPNWAPALTGGIFLAFFWLLTGMRQIRDTKVMRAETIKTTSSSDPDTKQEDTTNGV